MAVFNEILVGRFNRGLQKVFGTKGDPPSPSIAGEIAPTYELFTGLEDHYPQGIEHFSAIFTIAANAANTPGVQLRNPVGSGIICTVEKITVSPVIAQDTEVSIGSQTTDLSPVTTSQDRDGRGRAVGSCVASQSNVSPAVLGNPIWIMNSAATVDVILKATEEIVIFAGGALRITWSAVNQAVRATIYWRERVREDSEVT